MLVQGSKANTSRTLKLAEINYPIIEKEYLAVLWALEKLKPYLTQNPLRVVTDHRD